MRNKLNDVQACPDQMKSVASCVFRRKTMDTFSFRRQQGPVFQSILNVNFSRITFRHIWFSIPLFLDIFQLL